MLSVITGNASRVSTARQFVGATAKHLGLPRHLWCADFMNLVERKLGRRGTGSRLAMSFARYGRRLSGPAVGAIATMGRRGGGHVGVVSSWDATTVTIISGNHLGAVREVIYPRRRIRSYTM